jgi:hypothetical protein
MIPNLVTKLPADLIDAIETAKIVGSILDESRPDALL